MMVFSLSACGSASLTLEEGLATAQGIQNYQNSESFSHPNKLTISLYTENVTPINDNSLISKVTTNYVIDMTHSYFYSYTFSDLTYRTILPGNPDKVQRESKTTTKQWIYLNGDVLNTVNDSFVHVDDGTADIVSKTYQSQIIDVANDSPFSDLLVSLFNYYTGNDALNLLIGDPSNEKDGYFDEKYYDPNDPACPVTYRNCTIKSEGDGYLETNARIKRKSPSDLNITCDINFSNYYLSSYYYYEIGLTRYSKTKISISHETNRNYPNLNDYTIDNSN